MNKELNRRLLVIVHEMFESIADKEVTAFLENEGYITEPDIIRLPHKRVRPGNTRYLDWQKLKEYQQKWYDSEAIKEKVEYAKRKNHQICYFGFVPIPLAVHLGHLFGSSTNVKAYQKSPITKKWEWPEEDWSGFKEIEINDSSIFGDVAIQLEVSAEIESKKISDVLPNCSTTLQLESKKSEKGLIGSTNTINEIGNVFRVLLERTTKKDSNVQSIHLFAAIPCGVAFRIGQEIIKTMHAPVFTYEHHETEQPNYLKAFSVQEELSTKPPISETDKKKIQIWRENIDDQLKKEIPKLIKRIKDQSEQNWFTNLFPTIKKSSFRLDYWKQLHRLDETELEGSTMNQEPLVDSGNRYYLNRKWWLPDYFLHGLMIRYGDKKDLFYQAARLFFYREMIHRRSHQIKSENEEELAGFPQVLSEADYKTDVYAIMHEYFLETPLKNEEVSFFIQLIDIITETMWAEEDHNTDRIEVRRLNRYITWYFQQGKIQRSDCKTFEDVLEILAHRPLIELKLHNIYARGHKVEFNLVDFNTEELAIAIFHNGKVAVESHGGQLNLEELLNGFKERDPEKIKSIISDLLVKIGFEN